MSKRSCDTKPQIQTDGRHAGNNMVSPSEQWTFSRDETCGILSSSVMRNKNDFKEPCAMDKKPNDDVGRLIETSIISSFGILEEALQRLEEAPRVSIIDHKKKLSVILECHRVLAQGSGNKTEGSSTLVKLLSLLGSDECNKRESAYGNDTCQDGVFTNSSCIYDIAQNVTQGSGGSASKKHFLNRSQNVSKTVTLSGLTSLQKIREISAPSAPLETRDIVEHEQLGGENSSTELSPVGLSVSDSASRNYKQEISRSPSSIKDAFVGAHGTRSLEPTNCVSSKFGESRSQRGGENRSIASLELKDEWHGTKKPKGLVEESQESKLVNIDSEAALYPDPLVVLCDGMKAEALLESTSNDDCLSHPETSAKTMEDVNNSDALYRLDGTDKETFSLSSVTGSQDRAESGKLVKGDDPMITQTTDAPQLMKPSFFKSLLSRWTYKTKWSFLAPLWGSNIQSSQLPNATFVCTGNGDVGSLSPLAKENYTTAIPLGTSEYTWCSDEALWNGTQGKAEDVHSNEMVPRTKEHPNVPEGPNISSVAEYDETSVNTIEGAPHNPVFFSESINTLEYTKYPKDPSIREGDRGTHDFTASVDKSDISNAEGKNDVPGSEKSTPYNLELAIKRQHDADRAGSSNTPSKHGFEIPGEATFLSELEIPNKQRKYHDESDLQKKSSSEGFKAASQSRSNPDVANSVSNVGEEGHPRPALPPTKEKSLILPMGNTEPTMVMSMSMGPALTTNKSLKPTKKWSMSSLYLPPSTGNMTEASTILESNQTFLSRHNKINAMPGTSNTDKKGERQRKIESSSSVKDLKDLSGNLTELHHKRNGVEPNLDQLSRDSTQCKAYFGYSDSVVHDHETNDVVSPKNEVLSVNRALVEDVQSLTKTTDTELESDTPIAWNIAKEADESSLPAMKVHDTIQQTKTATEYSVFLVSNSDTTSQHKAEGALIVKSVAKNERDTTEASKSGDGFNFVHKIADATQAMIESAHNNKPTDLNLEHYSTQAVNEALVLDAHSTVKKATPFSQLANEQLGTSGLVESDGPSAPIVQSNGIQSPKEELPKRMESSEHLGQIKVSTEDQLAAIILDPDTNYNKDTRLRESNENSGCTGNSFEKHGAAVVTLNTKSFAENSNNAIAPQENNCVVQFVCSYVTTALRSLFLPKPSCEVKTKEVRDITEQIDLTKNETGAEKIEPPFPIGAHLPPKGDEKHMLTASQSSTTEPIPLHESESQAMEVDYPRPHGEEGNCLPLRTDEENMLTLSHSSMPALDHLEGTKSQPMDVDDSEPLAVERKQQSPIDEEGREVTPSHSAKCIAEPICPDEPESQEMDEDPSEPLAIERKHQPLKLKEKNVTVSSHNSATELISLSEPESQAVGEVESDDEIFEDAASEIPQALAHLENELISKDKERSEAVKSDMDKAEPLCLDVLDTCMEAMDDCLNLHLHECPGNWQPSHSVFRITDASMYDPPTVSRECQAPQEKQSKKRPRRSKRVRDAHDAAVEENTSGRPKRKRKRR